MCNNNRGGFFGWFFSFFTVLILLGLIFYQTIITLILPFRGYVDIDALDELLKSAKIKIKNNYRIYAFELIKKMVQNNLGIGWGPKKCIENELKEKSLYEIFLDFETPNTKFSITYNDRALNTTSKESESVAGAVTV